MRQGELYWVDFPGSASEPRGRRPAIVVQADRFNRGGIQTTVVAGLTSNLRLAQVPGNVRLKSGEANLPRDSVVNVSQLYTVDRSRLVEPIGSLARDRVREIVRGLAVLFDVEAALALDG